MAKRIVVLGANSFSGQDFVDMVLESGQYKVLGISRSDERSDTFLSYKRRDNLENYRYVKADMNHDMDLILSELDKFKPHFIINFAAQSEVAPSWDDPAHWFNTNTVALAKLVNHLRQVDYLERYLHVSSPEVYGNCVGRIIEQSVVNPSTPYAASKAAADMLLETYHKQFGFPLQTVRATNVYGAGQQLFKIIPRSVIYIKSGQTIQLHGGGHAIKSYIHIRDISAGELAILEKGRAGEMYHLSPSDGVTIRDLVSTISKEMGADFERVTEMVDERPGQDAAYIIDSSKAKSELGWEAEIGIEQGLKQVVRWVERYWDDIQRQPLKYLHKA